MKLFSSEDGHEREPWVKAQSLVVLMVSKAGLQSSLEKGLGSKGGSGLSWIYSWVISLNFQILKMVAGWEVGLSTWTVFYKTCRKIPIDGWQMPSEKMYKWILNSSTSFQVHNLVPVEKSLIVSTASSLSGYPRVLAWFWEFLNTYATLLGM
jgi:hypothetical protein